MGIMFVSLCQNMDFFPNDGIVLHSLHACPLYIANLLLIEGIYIVSIRIYIGE